MISKTYNAPTFYSHSHPKLELGFIKVKDQMQDKPCIVKQHTPSQTSQFFNTWLQHPSI